MDVYFGRFLSNGGCGYVLKPTYLRYDNAAAAATASSSIVSGRLSTNLYSSNTPQILHIKVSPTRSPRLISSVFSRWSVLFIFQDPNRRNWKPIRLIPTLSCRYSVCREIVMKSERKLSIITVGRRVIGALWRHAHRSRWKSAVQWSLWIWSCLPRTGLSSIRRPRRWISRLRFYRAVHPPIRLHSTRSVSFDSLIVHSHLGAVDPGYRHVHLYTIGGDLIANAYLFVHIVINSKSLAVVGFFLWFCGEWLARL